jgi:hypothetical protein
MTTMIAVAAAAALLAAPGCRDGKEGGYGTVTGRAVSPVDEVYVQVYAKGADLKSPPLQTIGPTTADGKFSVSLEPGEYQLVARKRKGGLGSGPVMEGDLKSPPYGPVTIVSGGSYTFDLVLEPKIGNLKEAPLAAAVGKTGIEGRIVDEDGKQVEGIRIQIYTYSQMSERPKYVSEKTGPDGRYLIALPAGGTYYLAARDKFGGPPKLGDLYGRYDQGTIEPSAVVVKEGELLKDVNITVTKVW